MSMKLVGVDKMSKNIDRMGVATIAKTEVVGETFAGRIEGLAQSGAPWTDRTGHARRSITGTAAMDAAVLRVALAMGNGNADDYTKYLEGYREDGSMMVRGRRWATIWPTITRERQSFLDSFRGVITK